MGDGMVTRTARSGGRTADLLLELFWRRHRFTSPARSLARALLPPPAACDSQVRLVVRPRNDLNFGERLKNNVVCAISSLMDICLQNRQIIIDQCPINICVKGANSY